MFFDMAINIFVMKNNNGGADLTFKKTIISILLLGSLALSMTGGVIPVQVAQARVYTPIEEFVKRMYTIVLGRPYDPSGLAANATALANGHISGIDVAANFFFSYEFNLRNTNDAQFVDIIYLALLGRPSDPGGRAANVEMLRIGFPREYVFCNFAFSLEYALMCEAAGIMPGTYTPPPGGLARVFATRLYREVLGRAPDPGGLQNWQSNLAAGLISGATAAYEFIFSHELKLQNLNNTQFVEMLYRSMLGRQADPGGLQANVNALQAGIIREIIFANFVNSTEFNNICNAHGIVRGTYIPPPQPPPASTMPGNTMVTRTWNLISATGLSGISNRPEHIAGIIGNMQAEAGAALCPFQQQVSNQVGLGLMQWSFSRRTALENYMWSNGVPMEQFFFEMNRHVNSLGNPNVCSNPAMHDQTLLDRVLRLQVDFMAHEFKNTSERIYMGFIDFPIHKVGVDGVRSYAELFCALSLRPGATTFESNNVQDQGVIDAMVASVYYGGAGNLNRDANFSNLNGRRNNAVNIYNQFINQQS